MCARYSLTSPAEAVRAFFRAPSVEDFPPRYNIAPSQPVLIARNDVHNRPELQLVRWGLIPSWLRDPKTLGSPLINARAETAAEKPAFRGGMRHRRCLVPTTGFYEWTGQRGARRPHLIRLKDQELFALAGIWEGWLGADGSEIETMAILTTAANDEMARLHDRMPVILDQADFDRWLDCRPGSAEGVLDLLKPYGAGRLSATAVNPKLNDARAEGPELQQPEFSTLL
ncbi:SOS response-associated peptidase [Hyphomicrobium facile]|uniref:Abasic site processing protein n=1 Tax=Hyphomicrobium facile TaxID=51670 RepID=A0A1I7NGR0_9HYPH|nr:SOS response-associated peptidase [Hyphomicrobium facile]SFV33852.1 Putative SOS response-associated peptidase YedK [Hyphomicrobium facile]